MKTKNKTSIFEKWPWEPERLRALAAVSIVAPLVLTGVLYPFGPWALGVLLTIPFGLLFRLIYGIVGKKVEQLARSVPRDGEDPVHALIVNGVLQSPGLATIKEDEIVLEPIAGERVVVRLADIASVHEVSWFNGARRLYKVGFWLSIPARQRLGGRARQRLGVAVSRVHADAWRSLQRPDDAD